ncbi:glycosyltransferase family 2 protein [Spirosoma rigui]|uniref:glycosyltransferase family 2 protein n=1 Tax=Spirosoma rigui TaxID=564064 RepID=UPI0009AFDDDC|nr:glycosyltransferase family 2 protein [Spirosoma rigui]
MFFSIVTCTYNPNPKVFIKLAKAVNALRINYNFSFEWLIVDNGTQSQVNDTLSLKYPLINTEYISIIKEPKAGLTNARITGVTHSKGRWIVFFDDDNEPDENYLNNIYNLIHKYPFVKCWGPGRVSVTLMDPHVPSWVSSRKDMFQEKHINEIIFSNEKTWSNCHPAGTGMIVETDVLTGYIDRVKAGDYTLTDRLGTSLSSGGDTQIVFHAVQQGMHVGLAPDLVINHNIAARKSTFKYLKKQTYAGCKSFMKAHNEVFIGNKYELVFKDNLGVAKRTVRWIMRNYSQIYKPLVALDFFALLGSLHSPYFVANRNPPALLRVFIYVLVGDK